MMEDKVKQLEVFRDVLHTKWNPAIDVGDFSYAASHPIVMFPDEAKLHIGKFCSIGRNVHFYMGGNHRTDWISTYPFNVLLPETYQDIKGHPASKGDIRIGNDVWIANDVKIMSGVHIGDGAVIATGALVTNDVKPYTIVGGVPACFIKYKFNICYVDLLKKMKWWDWPLEKIAEAVPLIQSDNIKGLIKFDQEWSEKV